MDPQTHQRLEKIDEKLEELELLKKRVEELEEKVDALQAYIARHTHYSREDY